MKAKPVIIIVATLIIGFILGMLTSAQIRHHRLNQFRVFFSEDRFREGFYRTIQPDENQKTKIDLVLDKYAKINGELQKSFRYELDSTMREFHREIDLYLTPEQIGRLREMDAQRERMIQRNRMMHKEDTVQFMRGRHRLPGMGPMPADDHGHHHGMPPVPGEDSGSVGKK